MRVASSPAASHGGWFDSGFPKVSRIGTGVWRLVMGGCCSCLSVASAAESADKRPAGLSGTPLGTDGILATAAGLLLVLATILALAWVARRYGRFTMAGKGMVSLLGGVTLGSRERVVVVQVEDTRLVLGVAPGRIQTLYVLNPAQDTSAGFPETLESQISELRR